MPKINLDMLVAGIAIIALFIFGILMKRNTLVLNKKTAHFWSMQSVDTVKFSRDPARQYANDPSFDETIDLQVKAIAGSGANYVAIGTPYDKEFIPFLQRWVTAARKYGLNIWFRGNFSGWEGWFNYPKITREEHEKLLKQFILDNGYLFANGDIFTSCTECENGGPGDPRKTGDISGHQQFLIDEYVIGKNAFAQIGKNVATNYFPMNADVAKIVMDPATTQSLGGVVVIDHYVPTPENLNQGVTDIASASGGKVVLGEFGAPIPDLQGDLTEKEQAEWIKSALTLLSNNKNLIGINYWTSFGGSTELWNELGSPRAAVAVLKNFFVPNVLSGLVINEAGQRVTDAIIISAEAKVGTDINGQFFLPFDGNSVKANVMANGYYAVGIRNKSNGSPVTIVLTKQNESMLFKLQKLLYITFSTK